MISQGFEEKKYAEKLIYQDFDIPRCKVKFNKNLHKVNNFMTKGLLISRTQKLFLHKTFLLDKTNASFITYKNYRNIYNNLIRKSREKFYTDSLSNEKNPKKIWDIYKELTTGKKSENGIKEILINGSLNNDSKEMAENFNTFFSTVGSKISKGIKKIERTADHFLIENPDTPLLKIDEVGPVLICDILKSLESKKSCDIDGISSCLLKYLNTTITVVLLLLLYSTLALKMAPFLKSLNLVGLSPFLSPGIHSCVITIGQSPLLAPCLKFLKKL